MKSLSSHFPISRSLKSLNLIAALVVAGLCSNANAHHPDWENMPAHPRIDVIGPKGNLLKPSYRFRYNRPRYLTGKIAYHIAPSSQEAMAWHRAVHADAYSKPKKHCRLEQHYFYPKPWEVLTVGPRKSKAEGESAEGQPESIREMLESEPLVEPAEINGTAIESTETAIESTETAIESTETAIDLPLIESERLDSTELEGSDA